MKRILEVLKGELVNNGWASEFDALGTLHGLDEVRSGKSTYYYMRAIDKFNLRVDRVDTNRFNKTSYIHVEFTDYQSLEERNFKVSGELFDRFVDALKKFAKDTEKDRMMERYRWEIQDLINKEVDKRLAKQKRHNNCKVSQLEKND